MLFTILCLLCTAVTLKQQKPVTASEGDAQTADLKKIGDRPFTYKIGSCW